MGGERVDDLWAAPGPAAGGNTPDREPRSPSALIPALVLCTAPVVYAIGESYRGLVALILGTAVARVVLLCRRPPRLRASRAGLVRTAPEPLAWLTLSAAVIDAIPVVGLNRPAAVASTSIAAVVLIASSVLVHSRPPSAWRVGVFGVAAAVGLGLIGLQRTSPDVSTVIAAPVTGDGWVVVQGGRSPLVNHHFGLRSQRHAIDLVKSGSRAAGDGRKAELSDYAAFGEHVVAPVHGEVARLLDAVRDSPVGERGDGPATGNYVVIRTADGHYVVLAHLRLGSVRVSLGDRVRAGDVVGEVGNSGNSSEPHLHLQVQDSADPAQARLTYPFAVSGLRVNGAARPTAPVVLRRNDRFDVTPAR